jgi:hypothetical protein
MSQAEQELELVEQAITKILSGQVSEYEIKGRQATYLDLDKLRELRNELRLRIKREQDIQNGRSRNTLIQWRNPE